MNLMTTVVRSVRFALYSLLLLAIGSVLSSLSPVEAESGDATSSLFRYRVLTQDLIAHTLRIEAEFPTSAFGGSEKILALPVWTPGSYKIRDYSKSLSTLELLDVPGGTVSKISKNRWRLEGDFTNRSTVKVAYTVYGHELTVRTNYFHPDLALIVGAATFVAPAPLLSSSLTGWGCQVDFPGYQGSISTSLEKNSGDAELSFFAPNYDELVDSPILLGKLEEHPFFVNQKRHVLVQAGDTRYWDLAKSLPDVEKIVAAEFEFWGEVPYDQYLFMNLVTDTRGGLEHLDSTVMMTSRFATQDREKYLEWLALVAHEFFHTWNVKRLRPDVLGPFDYETEVYTPSLWVVEGITSYYDDLLVRRAGLSTRSEYLKALSKQLNTLANTPGRKARPLSSASLDAWIRLYQPTDNSINDNISYYNKGAVVAWLLDTEIRRQTQGRRNLDLLMRAAYRRFSASGYSQTEFRAFANEFTGVDLQPFFHIALDTTQELPLDSALEYWGLEWKEETSDTDVLPFFGVRTSAQNGRLVESVEAGSPAAAAGISAEDELIAIDNLRIPVAGPNEILKHLEAGRTYTVLISRRGSLQSYDIPLEEADFVKRQLQSKSERGPAYQRLVQWLGPEKINEKTADVVEKQR